MGLFWLPAQRSSNGRDGPGEQFLMEVMPYRHTGWLLLMTAFVSRGCSTRSSAFNGERRQIAASCSGIGCQFRLHNRAFEGEYSACGSCRACGVIAVVTHLVMC